MPCVTPCPHAPARQVYEGQLTETRAKKTEEITELDGRLQHEYEARLQESLQDLRDQYEAQMRTNREEIEAIYNLKVSQMVCCCANVG